MQFLGSVRRGTIRALYGPQAGEGGTFHHTRHLTRLMHEQSIIYEYKWKMRRMLQPQPTERIICTPVQFVGGASARPECNSKHQVQRTSIGHANHPTALAWLDGEISRNRFQWALEPALLVRLERVCIAPWERRLLCKYRQLIQASYIVSVRSFINVLKEFSTPLVIRCSWEGSYARDRTRRSRMEGPGKLRTDAPEWNVTQWSECTISI